MQYEVVQEETAWQAFSKKIVLIKKWLIYWKQLSANNKKTLKM